jgi:hypothetical protein
MNEIRERMQKLGKTQVWLILELQQRGIVVQPPEMSSILRGVNTYPKATRVLEVCNDILSEIERGAERG